MEAAASARPVITTDSPGCKEAVDHGTTGLVVPARDTAALTAALVELLDHPETRSEMGRRARELAADCFDQDRALDTTVKIHRALVSADPSGRIAELALDGALAVATEQALELEGARP
jgi:glycosyltransferase involved in cell wall biosynthesis